MTSSSLMDFNECFLLVFGKRSELLFVQSKFEVAQDHFFTDVDYACWAWCIYIDFKLPQVLWLDASRDGWNFCGVVFVKTALRARPGSRLMLRVEWPPSSLRSVRYWDTKDGRLSLGCHALKSPAMGQWRKGEGDPGLTQHPHVDCERCIDLRNGI